MKREPLHQIAMSYCAFIPQILLNTYYVFELC